MKDFHATVGVRHLFFMMIDSIRVEVEVLGTRIINLRGLLTLGSIPRGIMVVVRKVCGQAAM